VNRPKFRSPLSNGAITRARHDVYDTAPVCRNDADDRRTEDRTSANCERAYRRRSAFQLPF